MTDLERVKEHSTVRWERVASRIIPAIMIGIVVLLAVVCMAVSPAVKPKVTEQESKVGVVLRIECMADYESVTLTMRVLDEDGKTAKTHVWEFGAEEAVKGAILTCSYIEKVGETPSVNLHNIKYKVEYTL